MIKISPKIKNIGIAIVIIIVLVVVYFYFTNNSSTPADTSGLSSQTGTQTLATSSSDQEINKDTAFLATLLSLGKTTIDPSIFGTASFTNLADNTVDITNDGSLGRPNPFIPFDQTIPSDTTTTLPQILPSNGTGAALPPATTTTGTKKN